MMVSFSDEHHLVALEWQSTITYIHFGTDPIFHAIPFLTLLAEVPHPASHQEQHSVENSEAGYVIDCDALGVWVRGVPR